MRPVSVVAVTLACIAAACGSPDTTEGEQLTDAEKRVTLDAMMQEVRDRYPTVQGISAGEVTELISTGDPVLVDVRTDAERLVSGIPGAITSEAFSADPARYAGRAVVAYCTVGERSARFAAQMAEEGVDVLNFEGSLLAWTHIGGPLVDAKGPTPVLHVYGPTWDLAATGYQTTW